ncbi:SPOR domain-containing protein [Pararhizobium qamdonense]|uniref:SPOR domain-containing protein n=1 Tax=Pararhizobium qamdonense TaxID=3031126 RepID=UPI0023E29149|nr:SPOR domain-containing protein [Pararhizobium qamdonense]
MAEKQLARSGAADFGVLADDDPLAELARIVGYDNRPAVQQLQELERHREMVSREPVLDLEDELLREFDFYDAPQVAPAVHAVDPVRAEEPVHHEEPVLHEELVHHVAEPVAVEAPLAFAPAQDEQPAAPEYPAEPPVVEFQAAEIAAPSVEAFTPAENIAPVAVDVPVYAESIAVEASAPVHDVAVAPIAEPVPQVDAGWAVEQWTAPDFDATDLERELELSIGYDDAQVEAAHAEASAVRAPHDEPEPDFSAAAIADIAAPAGVEPAVASPVIETPVTIETPVAVEPVHTPPATQAAVEPDVLMQTELPEWQDTPVSGNVVISPADTNGIDALLADIERFPVPPAAEVKVASPAEVARKVNYPFTPTFSRATPVASSGGASSQKAYTTPLAAAVVATPVMATAAEAVYRPAEAAVQPVIVEAAEALKPAVNAEPEFDLDTFELDLSDINLDIDPSEFDVAEFAAPELAAPELIPAVVQTAAAPVKTVAAAPAVAAAIPVAAPERYVPEAVEEVREEPESALAFDPSMISETEEGLTAITDLNVPQLPVVEQERPLVQHTDYDLDIDAEMAQLFAAPGRNAQSVDRGSHAPQAAAPVQASNVRVEEDFDEFEKAMEEDFRRSLNQPQDNDPSSDRLAVGSGYAANNDYDDEGRGSGRRRLALLAATVAGLAIFGGVGVYAFMGGTGSALSGGEPKIILADKSPVKMVPVEKGGKTVPNQDKAVYDRVAGAQDTTPQQGTLVSSTEEPIDVVQRTLTPENMPLDGADNELPGLMQAEEDGDERLLPDGQTASTADAEQTPAVSPRKVRTMIVKPDGTLVAREEPAPEPQTNVAANSGDPQINVVRTTTVAAPIETASTPRSQPVVEQLAEQGQKSALAEAAAATVDETAPVRSVKTTDVASAEAVPQTRPVAERKVVDTFKNDIAATQPAAAEKPVETASIAPGTYVIQIASLPSEAEAQTSYKTLSGKFGSVIGGKGVDIKKADIAGKGTYYRVRIPAGSRDAANAMCAQYKSAGGSCLVTR